MNEDDLTPYLPTDDNDDDEASRPDHVAYGYFRQAMAAFHLGQLPWMIWFRDHCRHRPRLAELPTLREAPSILGVTDAPVWLEYYERTFAELPYYLADRYAGWSVPSNDPPTWALITAAPRLARRLPPTLRQWYRLGRMVARCYVDHDPNSFAPKQSRVQAILRVTAKLEIPRELVPSDHIETFGQVGAVGNNIFAYLKSKLEIEQNEMGQQPTPRIKLTRPMAKSVLAGWLGIRPLT